MSTTIESAKQRGWGVLIHHSEAAGGGEFLALTSSGPCGRFIGTYREAQRFRRELKEHGINAGKLVRLAVEVREEAPDAE